MANFVYEKSPAVIAIRKAYISWMAMLTHFEMLTHDDE